MLPVGWSCVSKRIQQVTLRDDPDGLTFTVDHHRVVQTQKSLVCKQLPGIEPGLDEQRRIRIRYLADKQRVALVARSPKRAGGDQADGAPVMPTDGIGVVHLMSELVQRIRGGRLGR